jgi:hypothetical protein
MVAKISSVIQIVFPVIKYEVAPLEVGPEFVPNSEVGSMSDIWKYLLMNFEILN